MNQRAVSAVELKPPPPVRWLVRTLEDAGFETWAVGGAVRDALLGRPGEDWDLATRARPEEVRRTFRRTVPIGIDHGTVGVLTREGALYEVTTFRTDLETDGRHAMVSFADRIEDDLARRDFTINALAWHPIREVLLDPHGGADDLEARVLRTVGDPVDRFREDYLRVLRGLRFAGQLEMTFEEGTWRALCAARDRLGLLSPERIREELLKIMEASPRPSAALGLYAASGVLAELFPELDATVGLEDPRGPAESGGPDLWSRCLLSADVIRGRRPLLRLAAVMRGVGVPPPVPRGSTDPEDPGQSDHPWTRGGLRSAAMLERLRFSNAEVRAVAQLVAALLRPLPDPGSGPTVRHWLAEVDPSRLPAVIRVRSALARVEEDEEGAAAERLVEVWRAARAELASRVPLRVGDLALDGRDLISMGLEPGPHFGRILESLLDRVLDDPELNEGDALAQLVRQHPEGGPGGPDHG